MRVIFFGTSAFAVPSLEALVRGGHEIVACVTQPDRPRGRGLALEASPVKEAALQLKLPLHQPERLAAAQFAPLSPDVGVLAAYGKLIRRDLLELPREGVLGVHPSLLPKYRGAAPVAWALLSGERETGVTIFKLNEALDAGEILVQSQTPVGPDETTEALTHRLARSGAEDLLRGLELIGSQRAVFRPQDETQASYASKFTKAQGIIDWRRPAIEIDRLVRAVIPWPGASTSWRGTLLKIWKASVASAASAQPAGAVAELGQHAVVVAAGDGYVAIHELQPAGRRRMSAREFLAGYPLAVGDALGTSGPEMKEPHA